MAPKEATGRSGGPPRLLLVNPSTQELGWVKYFQLPPLSLLHVGAATPEPWEVTLVDETLDPCPENGFDLVGITVMTHQAKRAYELADGFRERGVPVVLGGIHSTVLPDEAGEHADAVVVGEAEPVWGRVLEDCLAGVLNPTYASPESPGTTLRLPMARRALLAGKRYLTMQTLQATRGCPYDCPFCTVTPYFGRRFRHRPVEEVVGEIAAFPKDFVLFLDDNVMGDPAYARLLLEKMVPLGKRWAGQATLRFAEDPGLLDLAVRSGCLGLYVGVEGLSGDSSKLSKRRVNEPMVDLVRRVQEAGILVEVSMIFGFDDQDEAVFEESVRFVEDCSPCGATFHLLTPYPGTAYFRRYQEEGRLLHTRWAHYNHDEVVFKPALMSPERLYAGWVEARKAVYSLRSILGRVWANPHHRLTNLGYNILRKGPYGALDPDAPPSMTS